MPKQHNTELALEPENGESMEMSFLKNLASRISPSVGDPNKLNRIWQWKQRFMEDWDRAKFDLYDELSKAPRPLTYKPGGAQLAAHKATTQTKQLVGGIRLGKSAWLAAELMPYMFKDKASVGIAAFTYEKTQYEYDYMRDWFLWLGATLYPDRSTNSIGKRSFGLPWGALLETISGDDESVFEGYNFDALGIAEAGLMKERNVKRSRTRLLEKGGPLLMSGSLDESQPWYTLAFEEFLKGPTDDQDWQSFSAPSWENVFAFPLGREDPKIKQIEAEMDENQFKLKVCAEVAKRDELVFPEFDKRIHVMNLQYSSRNPKDKLLPLDSPEPVFDDLGLIQKNWILPTRGPVKLAIDPGYSNAYAVLACRIYGDNVFVIDEIYAHRTAADDVIAECQQRWWWPEVDYAVMDIAGKQHHSASPRSDKEIWEQEKYLGFSVKMNYVPILDGISKLRTWLKTPGSGKPRIFIDSSCKGLISEFSMYMYRTPDPDRPAREEPIDNSNHALKSLEYLLVDRFGLTDRSRRGKTESYLNFSKPRKSVFDIVDWAFGHD